MTETVDVGRTWTTVIAICSLLFNAAVILYIVLAGDPVNSLHTSALAWCFASGLAILAGLGFGAISSLVPQLIKKD